MQDCYGRKITYLRLSVTDLCNLRCVYCIPECGVKKLLHNQIMSVEEIVEFVKEAAECGINKVRLTGGEPLVRNGIIDICRKISSIPEIKELCMTTNGILLEKYAKELKQAGVDRINISIDSLNEEKFKRITRCKNIDKPVDQIFRGIKALRDSGFNNIKLNVVLQGGINDDEIKDFIELTKDEDLEIRFIELMPIGEAKKMERKVFVSNESVLECDRRLEYFEDSGVAKKYKVAGYKGSVGLISPLSNHFCSRCNRIRLTADGKIKMCLHSQKEVSVKGMYGEELKKVIQNQINSKPKNYDIGIDNPSSSARGMNRIGG